MPGVTAAAPPLDVSALFASLAPQPKLALAVSGGADSLALMLLVAHWRAALQTGPDLVVYSVDHGLRPEAAAEVRFVGDEAARLGLPARGLRWHGDKPAAGLPAAARSARYRLMAEAMASDGATLLLTAHHLDDQAETVLMRLAHGSGPEGLRGMDRLSIVEGCPVCRPLLGVPRARLRQIVAAAGLVPVEDPSNADPTYERVRWRTMLPGLAEAGLTAGRLARFAKRMADLSELVNAAADSAYRALVTETAGPVELPQVRFAALPPPVAVVLLGEVLTRVSGDKRPVPLVALEALQQALAAAGPQKARSLHGCLVSGDGQRLVVRKEGPRGPAGRKRLAVEPAT